MFINQNEVFLCEISSRNFEWNLKCLLETDKTRLHDTLLKFIGFIAQMLHCKHKIPNTPSLPLTQFITRTTPNQTKPQRDYAMRRTS